MCEVRKTTDDLKSEGRNSVLKAPVTRVGKRSGEIEKRAVVEQGDQERPGAGGWTEGLLAMVLPCSSWGSSPSETGDALVWVSKTEDSAVTDNLHGCLGWLKQIFGYLGG